MKLPWYILFQKYIYILTLELASPGNQHCAKCIGTLSFLMAANVFYCLGSIKKYYMQTVLSSSLSATVKSG